MALLYYFPYGIASGHYRKEKGTASKSADGPSSGRTSGEHATRGGHVAYPLYSQIAWLAMCAVPLEKAHSGKEREHHIDELTKWRPEDIDKHKEKQEGHDDAVLLDTIHEVVIPHLHPKRKERCKHL